MLADTTGDGLVDIVGFGDAGVWVSRNNGDGTFAPPVRVVDNFAYAAGGWRVEKHPRMLADTTGDGLVDIVGFGDAGVWVSRNNGDGTFAPPVRVVDNFAYAAGGWRVEKHPRMLADTTGDGLVDIVGFGDAGVWVSRNNGDGTFAPPVRVVDNFAYDAGGWRVEKHPRMLADTTGDGLVDIVGFGDAGVWVSRNNGDGHLRPARPRRRQLRLRRRRLARREAPPHARRHHRRRPRRHRRLRRRRRLGLPQQRRRHLRPARPRHRQLRLRRRRLARREAPPRDSRRERRRPARPGRLRRGGGVGGQQPGRRDVHAGPHQA
jgi:hypothetical protein